MQDHVNSILSPVPPNTDMLLASWEVRIVKNYDRGLENAVRGQHFQDRGHSFFFLSCGPTQSWQITYLLFSSLSQINFIILSLPTTQTCRALVN